MTTNIYLENIAKKYGIKLDYIVFKNELSKIPYKPNLNIIINMSNVGHPGTHWVSLKTYKDIIIYFDSFGIESPEEVIYMAYSNNIKKIIFNDYQIQHFQSEMCGQHSLGVLAILQGKTIPSLLDDKVS